MLCNYHNEIDYRAASVLRDELYRSQNALDPCYLVKEGKWIKENFPHGRASPFSVNCVRDFA
jgi:hypothetical protein